MSIYPGLHKHFRMIAISQHLRNNGYTTPSDDHTRVPGIWKKLRSSYNLEALDDRVSIDGTLGRTCSCKIQENSFGDDASDDSNPAKESFSQFRLPQADFGDKMFSRRLAPDGSTSPSWLQQQSADQNSSGVRRASAVSNAGSEFNSLRCFPPMLSPVARDSIPLSIGSWTESSNKGAGT